MTEVTDLPLEVLSHIIKFLTYSDIQNIRLTCHTFYVAALDSRILDREIVIFDEEYYCFQPANLLLSNRNFLHLRLQNYSSFSYDVNVWSHIGPTLRSLCLVSCKFTERDLFAVLSHCSNLRYLEISACNVESRSAYTDVLRNITTPFKKLFSSETGVKRCDSYKKMRPEDLKYIQLTNLENFHVKDQIDSKVLKKILKNAPNLKTHSVTGFKKQLPERRKLSAKMGLKSDIFLRL